MKTAFLGNNWVGMEVLRWLVSEGEDIVCLALHPGEKRRFGEEMLAMREWPRDAVLLGSEINSQKTVAKLHEMSPDLIISVLFDYILKPEVIAVPSKGCLNLHPSYLPFNRGQYPNVWSIVEGTPAGVTLHYIDEGVDTGDIISQAEVPIQPTDTGESLYRRLEIACVDLFKGAWPSIKAGTNPRLPNIPENGTYHRSSDVERIDAIDLNRDYNAGYLIDVLRARSFPPYNGAYFTWNGRKVYMRLEFSTDEALQDPGSTGPSKPGYPE